MRDHEPRYPKTLADLGRLLSCEVRMEVFASVLQASSPVGVLAERLGLDTPLVSTHLGVLRRAGLLSRTTDKRTHIYSAGPTVRLRPAPTRAAPGRPVIVRIRARDGSELMFRLQAPPPAIAGRAAASET